MDSLYLERDTTTTIRATESMTSKGTKILDTMLGTMLGAMLGTAFLTDLCSGVMLEMLDIILITTT